MRRGGAVRHKVLFVLVAGAVSACTTMTPVTTATTAEHVVKRNFDIGALKSVAVGEAIVSLKDYYRKIEQNTWSIGEPVKVRVGLGSMVVIPGEYAVVGRAETGGTKFDVVIVKVHPYELTMLAPSSSA